MNENEIERIAAAMHHLRPDWPLGSLRTLIGKRLADRPRRDVAVALAWVACESNSATPARVCEPGPWWKAAAVETAGNANHPPHRDEVCGKHPAYRRTNCGGCAADELAADDEQTAPTTYAEVEAAGATYAKALLAEAAADNCPHGIRRGLCKACGEGA